MFDIFSQDSESIIKDPNSAFSDSIDIGVFGSELITSILADK